MVEPDWTMVFAAMTGLNLLIGRAAGRTLELGAGTGLNLPHYTDAVSESVLTEPFAPMARRLRARVDELGIDAEVVEAAGEQLPFDDDSFDTVVTTLMLCTVQSQAANTGQCLFGITCQRGQVKQLQRLRLVQLQLKRSGALVRRQQQMDLCLGGAGTLRQVVAQSWGSGVKAGLINPLDQCCPMLS